MTKGEKEKIRRQPCAMCSNTPPFADGSRCHVHRVIRGKDGGQYILSNVIPLCPSCHRLEDGRVMIEAAYSAGSKGGRRTHELHPNQATEWGKKYGSIAGKKGIAVHLANRARYGPTQKELQWRQQHGHELGKRYGGVHQPMAIAALIKRKQLYGLTAAELEHQKHAGRRAHELHPGLASKAGKARMASMTPDQRSAFGRRAILMRWYKKTDDLR